MVTCNTKTCIHLLEGILLIVFYAKKLKGVGAVEVNVALKKPSKQSSTYGILQAENGNDGYFNTWSGTNFNQGYEWWEVDLELSIAIKNIVLHLERKALELDKYQTLMVSTRITESDSWAVCKDIANTTSTPVFVECDRPTRARYVRVMLSGRNLVLVEVQVYESKDFQKKTQPKVSISRNAISNGIGFYVSCDIIENVSTHSMQSCYQHCLNNGLCRSFSYSIATKKCLTSKQTKENCLVIEEEGFSYFDVI